MRLGKLVNKQKAISMRWLSITIQATSNYSLDSFKVAISTELS
jgi:hypothetical protein